MKQKVYSEEQIIAILREAERGKAVIEVCREHNIADTTFYRWRRKYGKMEVADAKRLRALEKENTELKKIVADQMLENKVLKFGLSKKW